MSAHSHRERLFADLGKATFLFMCHPKASPIEELLLLAMVSPPNGDPNVFTFYTNKEPTYEEDDFVALAGEWRVIQQFKVARFTLDFAVSDGSTHIAVECDGHDFHERTKEQAKRDRSRDRFLTRAGWRVLRFTGSEIHADPRRCVLEIAAQMALTCQLTKRFLDRSLTESRRLG